MKAIKITQELKKSNNSIGAVGGIKVGIPKNFKVGKTSYIGYDTLTQLHDEHGWKDVVTPTLGENEVLDQLTESGNTFTYTIRTLTAEEIAARDRITMPRNDFKMALLEKHGITNTHVDALFADLISNGTVPALTVEKLKIMWYESTHFRSTTPELFQFAHMMNSIAGITLTQENLKKIFTDYETNN